MNILSFLAGNIVMILMIAGVIFLCWESIKKQLVTTPLLGVLTKVFSFFGGTSKTEKVKADGIKAFHDLLDFQLLNGTDEQVKKVLELALDVRPKPEQ